MKIFALLLAIFVLAASVMALKDPVCGEAPGVLGRCRAAHRRYTYIAENNECMLFIYGGCGGTANKFRTMEECEATCKE